MDCSQAGDRLCDITQPGGYCTVYNCEPGACPSESACVAFDAQLSPLAECRDFNGLSRFERSFCMLNCDSDSECRAGYVCADLASEENRARYNALIIDSDRGNKVCVAAFNAKPVGKAAEPHATEVCTGTAPGDSAAEGGAPSTPDEAGSGGSGD